jgi:hypothetical protein
MKTKLFRVCLIILSLAAITFAQSVTVTPKKTIYKRPKPLMDFKKNFTVTRPKIKGLSLALAKKSEDAVSYEKNFDFNIKEEINEIQWLEEASYDVDYNKNGILGVTLWLSGSGAYPSVYSKPVIVNLKNGERASAKNVFLKLTELAEKVKKAQREEVKKAIVDIKKENPEEENPATLFEDTNYTVKNLDEFSIDDKGITFWYDYGFPHVVLALQPEGRYFFTWAQIKPFIRREGLLGRFVR